MFRIIYNLKWYWKTIVNDRDDDFTFINKLLLVKLKKVEKFWGSNTDYMGDYDDKVRLKELINTLESITQEQMVEEDERKNKKSNFKIYAQLGHFIPKLWT